MRGLVLVVLALALGAGVFRWALDLQSRATPLNWTAKRVVVTGASSGIGREIALQLARKGAALLLIARREAVLQHVRQECLDAGAASVALVVGDLSHKVGVENAIESIQYTWKEIDVLILNHGLTGVKPFGKWDDADVDTAEQLMFLNFHSNVRMIYALRSRVTKGGSIAAVGSLAGVLSPPNRAAYGPSKAALRSFFQIMHHDMVDVDVYWTYLAPGYVRTEIHDKLDSVKRKDMSAFMSVERCAELSIEGIARGRREHRYEWLPLLLMPLEGFHAATGVLDGLVRRKANGGVQYEK